jgi:hypothetical protein
VLHFSCTTPNIPYKANVLSNHFNCNEVLLEKQERIYESYMILQTLNAIMRRYTNVILSSKHVSWSMFAL